MNFFDDGARTLDAAGELRFGVKGLHCASCVNTLEKKLLSKEKLDAILQPDVLTKPRPLLAARE